MFCFCFYRTAWCSLQQLLCILPPSQTVIMTTGRVTELFLNFKYSANTKYMLSQCPILRELVFLLRLVKEKNLVHIVFLHPWSSCSGLGMLATVAFQLLLLFDPFNQFLYKIAALTAHSLARVWWGSCFQIVFICPRNLKVNHFK